MLLLPQYHLLLSRQRERETRAFRNAGPGGFVPMRSIMLLLPQYHLLLSRQRERETLLSQCWTRGIRTYAKHHASSSTISFTSLYRRERERERPSFRNAGPGGFVPMRSIMLLLPQHHSLLSRQRERDLPFVMLDQGASYLCEASCFFFHNIIHFSLDREREWRLFFLQCWTREMRNYAKHHASS